MSHSFESVAAKYLAAKKLSSGTCKEYRGTGITGLGGLIKDGPGTLILTGAPSTYSGPTIINDGTLAVVSDAILPGIVPEKSAVTVANDATLALIGNVQQFLGSLSGTGTVEFALGNPQLTVGGDNTSTTFSGNIIQSNNAVGELIKVGDGALTLTAANTYSGDTFVVGGILLANNTTGSATGQGNVEVLGNPFFGIVGALGGVGAVAGNVEISGPAILAPGASAGASTGTLTIGGDLELHPELFFIPSVDLELGGTAAGQFDKVVIGGTAMLDGTLNVSLTSGYIPQAGDSFDVFDWDSHSGTFETVNLPGGGLIWDISQLYTTGTLSVAGMLGDYSHDGVVNAADYVVWRNTEGQTGAGLAADGNFNNQVDADDYLIWRIVRNPPSGSGAGTIDGAAVPEPTTVALFLIAIAAMSLRRPTGASLHCTLSTGQTPQPS